MRGLYSDSTMYHIARPLAQISDTLFFVKVKITGFFVRLSFIRVLGVYVTGAINYLL